MLGSACYIEGALSSLLFLAYEFADDFEAGVLANANCGGIYACTAEKNMYHVHRQGSYMSAHVLLSLLNELRESDKM